MLRILGVSVFFEVSSIEPRQRRLSGKLILYGIIFDGKKGYTSAGMLLLTEDAENARAKNTVIIGIVGHLCYETKII
jgi:hypothetical protein